MDDSKQHHQHFATTQWTIVLAAGRDDGTRAQTALTTLCERYWYPLYAYIRRHGRTPEEAADLTQGFFARLLEKNVIAAADPNRGKFRSYLLGSLKHFIANEWDKTTALKRGGSTATLSLHLDTAEEQYSLEPAHDVTPERLFEHRWALAVLTGVLADLRAKYAQEGKEKVFDHLKGFLTGAAAECSYTQAAAELKMTTGAVKVAVHRMRRRYRDLLVQHIGQTVASPEDVEAEIQYLFASLARS